MKRTSEKSFGILFFVVMFLIGIWPLLNNNSVRVWALVLSFIFLGIALLKQELLKPLNSLWIKFGENLGKIISPIVMAIIFFCFRLYSRFLYSNASPTASLIYITLLPYMLFLPRGSLSNAFPEVISVLIYWCGITFLVTGVSSLFSKSKYGYQF